MSLAGVQRHWQGPGDSLFFQGIGGSGFFFDQRTTVFCRCDVGFFEFQISFEIRRHRLAVPVFNGACQTETLTGGGWLYWKLPCLQASVAKVNQPRPVSVCARGRQSKSVTSVSENGSAF